MRDHRDGHDPTDRIDISALVESHATKHPGTVKRPTRTAKEVARAKTKRAKLSRRANRK